MRATSIRGFLFPLFFSFIFYFFFSLFFFLHLILFFSARRFAHFFLILVFLRILLIVVLEEIKEGNRFFIRGHLSAHLYRLRPVVSSRNRKHTTIHLCLLRLSPADHLRWLRPAVSSRNRKHTAIHLCLLRLSPAVHLRLLRPAVSSRNRKPTTIHLCLLRLSPADHLRLLRCMIHVLISLLRRITMPARWIHGGLDRGTGQRTCGTVNRRTGSVLIPTHRRDRPRLIHIRRRRSHTLPCALRHAAGYLIQHGLKILD